MNIFIQIKTFDSELVASLESSLTTTEPTPQTTLKRYSASHKIACTSRDKLYSNLRKHRKRSKSSKFGGIDPKQAQIERDLNDAQARLDNFRVQSLKTAFLSERRWSCNLLNRILNIIRSSASLHSKSHELLTHRLPEWTSIGSKWQKLPESSESFLMNFAHPLNVSQSNGVSPPPPHPHPHSHAHSHSNSNSSQQNEEVYSSPSEQEPDSSGTDYEHAEFARSKARRPYEDDWKKVRAVYSFTAGNSGTQLSITEGDVINVVAGSNRGGGWLYGQNERSNLMGWFPASFTIPVDGVSSANRVKSLGDLATLPNSYIDPESGHAHTSSSTPHTSRRNTGTNTPRYEKQEKHEIYIVRPERPPPIPPTQSDGPPAPPPPPPPPPDINTIVNNGHNPGGSFTPSPPNSSSGYSGASGLPPPPPLIHEEEEPPLNNPFTNVTLRKTVTNDRSAPKIR